MNLKKLLFGSPCILSALAVIFITYAYYFILLPSIAVNVMILLLIDY
jgi:hypothetical protein